jgi:ubiquinone/menaquinone biosynthesis C-methylase UbiE
MSVRDQWTSGADYDQWMGRWSRLLAHEFLNCLALPGGLGRIDTCCGSGIVTEAIVERSAPASVVGIDVSAEQINFARVHRRPANVTFETGDAMALPFPDASFDVAVQKWPETDISSHNLCSSRSIFIVTTSVLELFWAVKV